MDRAEPLANPARASKGDVMRNYRGSTLTVAMSTAVLVLAATVGVSGQADPDRPSVPVNLDTNYFVGTETCEPEFQRVDYVDGFAHSKRHWSCTTEFTDPRVVGTEELDVTSYGGWTSARGWTADGVLSTAEGVWRGSGRGVTEITGASGMGMAGFPFSYGEMTYVGEGAYDGLVMHYYMAGHPGNVAVTGWVTPAE